MASASRQYGRSCHGEHLKLPLKLLTSWQRPRLWQVLHGRGENLGHGEDLQLSRGSWGCCRDQGHHKRFKAMEKTLVKALAMVNAPSSQREPGKARGHNAGLGPVAKPPAMVMATSRPPTKLWTTVQPLAPPTPLGPPAPRQSPQPPSASPEPAGHHLQASAERLTPPRILSPLGSGGAPGRGGWGRRGPAVTGCTPGGRAGAFSGRLLFALPPGTGDKGAGAGACPPGAGRGCV